ncbi:MAG: phosphate-starvation-inducible PsiE family protein [Gemmatimonadota bacterium]
MDEQLQRFERAVILALIVLMAVVVVLATLEFAWILVLDILSPPVVILEVDELLELFGIFLLVLISLELLEILRAYLGGGAVRLEVVLVVASIAVARKVIVVDVGETSAGVLIGLATLILALAASYHLWHRAEAGAGKGE